MKSFFTKIAIISKDIFVKYFIVINIVAVIISLALGFYFFLSPSILRLRAGKSQGLQARIKEEKRLSDYVQELENMRSDFGSYTEERLNDLKLILPKEEDFPGIFVQMQHLALRNNFILDSIDIAHVGTSSGNKSAENNNEGSDLNTPEVKSENIINDLSGGRIKLLNISFIISGGNYEDLKNFLRDVEKNIRIFDIYDIRFGSVNGGPFSINLRTYYLVF